MFGVCFRAGVTTTNDVCNHDDSDNAATGRLHQLQGFTEQPNNCTVFSL